MKLRTLALAGFAATLGVGARALHTSAASPAEVATRLSGDDLVPDATVSMDRAATFDVPPEVLWPWIAQLGKGRGGWYFPRWLDAVTPRARRSLRRIDAGLTAVQVGDEHADWGPSNPVLRVSEVVPGRSLAYHSPRRDFEMSWQLVLTPQVGGTRLHLRVRARTKTKLFARLGDIFDGLTVALLFAGLRERIDA